MYVVIPDIRVSLTQISPIPLQETAIVKKELKDVLIMSGKFKDWATELARLSVIFEEAAQRMTEFKSIMRIPGLGKPEIETYVELAMVHRNTAFEHHLQNDLRRLGAVIEMFDMNLEESTNYVWC